MKMRQLFYTIILIIGSIFTMSMHEIGPYPPEEPKEPIYAWANAIRSEIIKKYTKKYNLQPTAMISGWPGGAKVEKTGMMFRRYQLTSKAKARQILVEMAQDYLDKMNSCEKLQPYLENRPFTVKNLDLTIIMLHPDGSKIFHPDLNSITTEKNKIVYIAYNPGHPNLPIEEKETFEEAVELVKTEIPP